MRYPSTFSLLALAASSRAVTPDLWASTEVDDLDQYQTQFFPDSHSPCIVKPSGGDDAPAIISAFRKCGQNGQVSFLNETYHIESIMNISGLHNCIIDLKGTLLWGTNITYWLENSMPMGYQNQSTAWILGGDNVTFNGHGYGTINGNGQVWYDFINGVSNYPRRPHALTISHTKNSIFSGLRFIQSQMWSMTVIHSKNVLLEDIYVSSRSTSGTSSMNTDGADTIYADNITFDRWSVRNGDDAISPKANSTNIFVKNSTFYDGSGIALGSIGQYNGVFERIENFTAENIRCVNTLHSIYFKTWTGQQVGSPPNGGGAGLGYIKGVRLRDFQLEHVRNTPISITQCTTYSGEAGDCNSSKFVLSDIKFEDVTGTIDKNPIASFQCSKAAGCTDFTITGINLRLPDGSEAIGYNCNNLIGTIGFNCTGPTCDHPTGDGTC